MGRVECMCKWSCWSFSDDRHYRNEKQNAFSDLHADIFRKNDICMHDRMPLLL